jgi:ribosomal protein S18 acetylase RimI-like enzyme
MPDPRIRTLTVADYEHVTAVVDEWWGGRPVRSLLPRLFFEHFNPTSFAVGDVHELQGFLIGFVSQSNQSIAYIHFVGVDPSLRALGLGRKLYEHFFQVVESLGCTEVRCITSPVNTGSIEFHRRMGFVLLPGSGEVGGVPVTLNHAGAGQHRVQFQKTLEPRRPGI